MSDSIPYPSTRFSTFTEQMLEGYLGAFDAALAEATREFTPDIIHSNHLWLLTALAQALTRQPPRAAECGAPRRIACRLAPLSWAEVFDRVAAAYRELAMLSPAAR